MTTRQLRKQERERTRERIAAAIAETRRIVATGQCPQCGTALRRNLALAGWYQCGAFGRPDFRRPEDRDRPDCNWQGFTE